MFNIFGPHRTFHVVGYFRIPGNLTLNERFIIEYDKKELAETHRNHVRRHGDHDGRTYLRVEVKSVEVQRHLPDFGKTK